MGAAFEIINAYRLRGEEKIHGWRLIALEAPGSPPPSVASDQDHQTSKAFFCPLIRPSRSFRAIQVKARGGRWIAFASMLFLPERHAYSCSRAPRSCAGPLRSVGSGRFRKVGSRSRGKCNGNGKKAREIKNVES